MSEIEKRQTAPGSDSSIETSDQSLLERYREGEEQAAESLYRRYAHRLRGLVKAQLSADLARRIEAEDVVQSVFRTFFRRVGKGQYDVPRGEDLWKLFLVICLNKIRSQGSYHFAAKRDVRAELGSEARQIALEEISKEGAVAETFLHLVVEEALSGLPAAHQQIVQLRLEGYEVAEISAKINRSKRTTERILQQIRTQLEQVLKQELDDDGK